MMTQIKHLHLQAQKPCIFHRYICMLLLGLCALPAQANKMAAPNLQVSLKADETTCAAPPQIAISDNMMRLQSKKPQRYVRRPDVRLGSLIFSPNPTQNLKTPTKLSTFPSRTQTDRHPILRAG